MAFRRTKIAFALLFLVIYIFIRPSFQQQRQMDFPEIRSNSFQYKYFSMKKTRRLLHGTITGVQVYDDLACIQQCTRLKDSCLSVNFKKQPTNGLHLCELLTTNWHEQPDALEQDEQFDHISLMLFIYSPSCAEIPSKISGVYRISLVPSHSPPVHVFCDMETNGGGWTVIQRRLDGSVDFFRDWAEYKRGFGNKVGEYWLGLDNIHAMTSQSTSYRLRVELTDFKGNTTYAEYSSFRVSSEADNYRLSIGEYSGTADDSLAYHNGMQFSTKDRDNHGISISCAVKYTGAWWYKSCHMSNLNGQYLGGANSAYGKGIVWKAWLGYDYSLKSVSMKIKPV